MATTEIFTVDDVVLSFPHLASPDRYDKYSAEFMVEPGSPADKRIQKAIAEVAAESWGDNAKAAVQAAKVANRMCYRNAEDVKDLDRYPNYKGKWVLRTSERRPPTLLDSDMSQILPPADKLYPGAVVRPGISIWTHVYEGVKQVNCNLVAVQFLAHGERLGGYVPPSKDDLMNLGFAPMADDSEDDALDDLLG